jgi:hypothetical protein
MAVTRIKNNQITDATITAQKIANQTLVGSLFSPDLTLVSNLSIVGNLTVTGNTSNINAINTFVTDPFVIFNNGYNGSLANYTIGFLVNRNLASLAAYGAVNTAWIWSESDGAFVGMTTTDTGSGITSINNSGYANVKVGNLEAVSAITASTFNIGSAFIIGGSASTLVVTNLSSGNAVISGGYISSLSNATITTGNASSWYATALNSTNGNITTLTSTQVDAGTTTTAILNSTTGNITTLGAGTTTSAILNATTGNITTLGASTTTSAILNATTGNITTLDAGTTTTAILNSTTGNITTLGAGTTTTAILNSTTGNITTLSAGTTTSAILNATTGNITTLGAGTTTTEILNTTNGNITNGNSTTFVATNFSTGNARITGGYADNFPIGANVRATGAFTTLTSNSLTTFTDATQSTTSGDGAVVVTGGVGVGKNLNVGGNVVISGNLTVQGDVTTLNTSTLDVEDLNITIAKGAANPAAANGAGLTVDGAAATILYNSAPDAWTFNKGVSIPTLVATNFSSGNAVVTGGSINNTVIGNTTPAVGTFTNLRATGNILADAGTTSTTYTTGAIVVPGDGGVGIGGNLNVRGTSDFTGNITAGNILVSGNINVTVGAVASSYGVFYGNAGGIGALYAGTTGYTPIDHTVLQMTADINNYAQLNFQNINTGSSASSDIVATADNGDDFYGYINLGISSSTYNDINRPDFFPNDSYLIGHGVGTSGNLIIISELPGTAIRFRIGDYDEANAKATVTSTGFRVNTATASTTSTSGALVVDGGAGIAGALNVGGNITVGNVISSSYYSTGGTTRFQLTDIGIVSVAVAGQEYKFGASGIESSPGIFGGSFGGSKLSLNNETNLIANRYDIVKIQTGTDGSIQNEWTFSNSAMTAPGRITAAGNIVAAATTASTSTTTGALVVAGGTGIASNITVGLGAEFNTSKTANYDFVVRGVNDNTLIWARPSSTYDAVVIGNSATTGTLVNGAKLIVNTTDSIIIPVGTTGQRPGSVGGTDAAGMIRFNSSTDQLEYHDGTGWNNTGTTFTVIAADSFDGDDSATIFTLGAVATTNGCIVSINGVVQIPTTAYSVSGTTLTFTSPPATGDKIDVRRLTTTSTVTILQSQNGYVAADAQNDSLILSAGTSSLTERLRVHTNGNVNISGNLVLGANIIAGGTNGTAGQFLSSTGTGLSWVSLSASSISNGTSNVTVASNGGITFGVGSANVITVGSTAVVPNANVAINLGNTTKWFGTFYGVSTQAQYADLAENYQADQLYTAGTVLEFGGTEEVTVAMTEGSVRVAGIVSSNPAHLMNGGLRGSNVVALALVGRVPCNVIGPVHKGDMMVSAGYGYAKASSTPVTGSVIGKALQNFEGDKGVIEVVVGRV